jgi:general secretion pathway protein I
MRRETGFTLLEVMIALAILAGALVVLLRLATADVEATKRARMLSIATGLARAKMYDVEEELLQLGAQSNEFCPAEGVLNEGDFADDGQPRFKWKVTPEKVELPDVQDLQEAQKDGTTTTTEAPLKDVSSELGLTGAAGTGAAMVQMYFPLVKPVLEQAICKVTVTVSWPISKDQEEKMDVICFFTNTRAIDQAAALATGQGGTGTTGTGTTGTGAGTTGAGQKGR